MLLKGYGLGSRASGMSRVWFLCLVWVLGRGACWGDDAVSRFRGYLRIDTAHPDPDYGAAAEFLLAQAVEIGLEAQRVEFVEGKPVVLISWTGSDPSLSSVLLNSHMDVVPAEKAKWTHDPFLGFEVRVCCPLHGLVFCSWFLCLHG